MDTLHQLARACAGTCYAKQQKTFARLSHSQTRKANKLVSANQFLLSISYICTTYQPLALNNIQDGIEDC